MKGTQGQVLKAELHHFKIHNQFLGVFYYYYFKVQVSKTVSFFSLAFLLADLKKKSINAAVHIIAVCDCPLDLHAQLPQQHTTLRDSHMQKAC